MKKVIYLLFAGSVFIFSACGGGETTTEETVVEESILQVAENCSICGEPVCMLTGEGSCLEDCSCCTNEEEDMRGTEGIEEDKAIER